jgi:hypothetical protein
MFSPWLLGLPCRAFTLLGKTEWRDLVRAGEKFK